VTQADRAPHSLKTFQAQQHGDEVIRFYIIHGSDILRYGSSEGMRIATHYAPGFLELIGQDYPSLRDAKQRSLAPSSDLDAINGIQPIRFDFAGRHPHPQMFA
jgi:hypothetical protein